MSSSQDDVLNVYSKFADIFEITSGLIEANMNDEIHSIKETAVEMSPVDTGDLSLDIEVLREAEASAAGRYLRWSIGVPHDGKSVEYALEAHSDITPYGIKNLGPGSSEKQNLTNLIVGGGFLDRALMEHHDKIISTIASAFGSFK